MCVCVRKLTGVYQNRFILSVFTHITKFKNQSFTLLFWKFACIVTVGVASSVRLFYIFGFCSDGNRRKGQRSKLNEWTKQLTKGTFSQVELKRHELCSRPQSKNYNSNISRHHNWGKGVEFAFDSPLGACILLTQNMSWYSQKYVSKGSVICWSWITARQLMEMVIPVFFR